MASSTALGASTEASGVKSVAVGSLAKSTANASTALGAGASASSPDRAYRTLSGPGTDAVALGANTKHWCPAVALGDGSQATHTDAVAIGPRAATTANSRITIGTGTTSYQTPGLTASSSDPAVVVTNQDGVLRVATFAASGLPNSYCLSGGAGATCYGQKADATGGGTTVGAGHCQQRIRRTVGCCYCPGTFSTATGAGSTSLGVLANASGEGSISSGMNSSAAGRGSLAYGFGASATEENTMAMGGFASANGDNSVAIAGSSWWSACHRFWCWGYGPWLQ